MKIYKKVTDSKNTQDQGWTMDVTHDDFIDMLIKYDPLMRLFQEWIATNRQEYRKYWGAKNRK